MAKESDTDAYVPEVYDDEEEMFGYEEESLFIKRSSQLLSDFEVADAYRGTSGSRPSSAYQGHVFVDEDQLPVEERRQSSIRWWSVPNQPTPHVEFDETRAIPVLRNADEWEPDFYEEQEEMTSPPQTPLEYNPSAPGAFPFAAATSPRRSDTVWDPSIQPKAARRSVAPPSNDRPSFREITGAQPAPKAPASVVKAINQESPAKAAATQSTSKPTAAFRVPRSTKTAVINPPAEHESSDAKASTLSSLLPSHRKAATITAVPAETPQACSFLGNCTCPDCRKR